MTTGQIYGNRYSKTDNRLPTANHPHRVKDEKQRETYQGNYILYHRSIQSRVHSERPMSTFQFGPLIGRGHHSRQSGRLDILHRSTKFPPYPSTVSSSIHGWRRGLASFLVRARLQRFRCLFMSSRARREAQGGMQRKACSEKSKEKKEENSQIASSEMRLKLMRSPPR